MNRTDRDQRVARAGQAAGGATFSVVVPFFDEADNVRSVLQELRAALPEAEIIAVDDGSTDATWQEILKMPGIAACGWGAIWDRVPPSFTDCAPARATFAA